MNFLQFFFLSLFDYDWANCWHTHTHTPNSSVIPTKCPVFMCGKEFIKGFKAKADAMESIGADENDDDGTKKKCETKYIVESKLYLVYYINMAYLVSREQLPTKLTFRKQTAKDHTRHILTLFVRIESECVSLRAQQKRNERSKRTTHFELWTPANRT